MSKQYLGDAVCAEYDQFGDLKLTTEDGYSTTNVIILEPQVIEALLDYIHNNNPVVKSMHNKQ